MRPPLEDTCGSVCIGSGGEERVSWLHVKPWMKPWVVFQRLLVPDESMDTPYTLPEVPRRCPALSPLKAAEIPRKERRGVPAVEARRSTPAPMHLCIRMTAMRLLLLSRRAPRLSLYA